MQAYPWVHMSIISACTQNDGSLHEYRQRRPLSFLVVRYSIPLQNAMSSGALVTDEIVIGIISDRIKEVSGVASSGVAPSADGIVVTWLINKY